MKFDLIGRSALRQIFLCGMLVAVSGIWMNSALAGPYLSPQAILGGPYLASYGQSVQLDGTGSIDPNLGGILNYGWDFSNTGTFTDSTLSRPTFTPNTPGDFNIGLRVTDSISGLSSVGYTTLDVAAQQLSASAGGPYIGYAGQSILLSGAGSFDPNPGGTLSYAWDLTGNGTFADSSSANPQFVVTGGVGASSTVCVKVSDNYGAPSTPSCSSVTTVLTPSPPILVFDGHFIGVFATSPAGAVLQIVPPTATDYKGNTIPVESSIPGSIFTFPLGLTSVLFTATDSLNLTSTGEILVRVYDPPPLMDLPSDIRVQATSDAGAIVTFSASATDYLDGTDPVTSSIASGSLFPVGTTEVFFSAFNSEHLGKIESRFVTVVGLDSAPVPEPSSLLLVVAGLFGFGMARKRG